MFEISIVSSFAQAHLAYTYEEAFPVVLRIIAVVFLLAVANTITAFIIGIRRKDCLAVFWVNMLVKMLVVCPIETLRSTGIITDISTVPFALVFIIALTVLVEGCIYMKVLTSKKYPGVIMSTLCNIGAVIFLGLFIAAFLQIYTVFNYGIGSH